MEAIFTFIKDNPDLLIKAISTFLKENPELINTELKTLSENLEYAILEQTKDRRRIRNIECILGLVEKQEIEDFEENPEELQEIFSRSILSKIKSRVSDKESIQLIYDELGKVPSMRNRDVLLFLKMKKTNTAKATRLMRLIAETYKDVVCEPVPGSKRILRIYRKKNQTL
jgi:hypothetical protein